MVGGPEGLRGRVPVCFWAAALSAVLMKGIMRDLMPSMSCAWLVSSVAAWKGWRL